jgi:hypothetical protein
MVQAHASAAPLLPLLLLGLAEEAATGLGVLLLTGLGLVMLLVVAGVVAGLLVVVGAAGRATGAGAGAGGLGVGAVYPAVRGSYWMPRACSSGKDEMQ